MTWQEIVAAFIVTAAGGYVVWRLRGRKAKARDSAVPDVPVRELTKKRSERGPCGH